MADMKFEFECCAKPTIEFSGTVDELIEFARKYSGDKPEEIEGPVRVGDTIEITKAATDSVKRGKRYKVARIDDEGYPRVDGYGISDFGLALSNYRIVARKEETPQPAKPSVKVGDHIIFDEGNAYITAGKAYKVIDVDSCDDPIVVDNDGDEISAGGSAPEDYRIITDTRELAFAKAGRKLDEFKVGDIVRVDENAIAGHSVGDFGYADRIDSSDNTVAIVTGNGRDAFNWYKSRNARLIAPAEARVDADA